MLALLILLALDFYILAQTGASSGDTKKWTVFGTMGCGWTRKQLDYMKKNGKPHVFVDCDKGGCDGMTAFPTLKGPNGEKIVGYNEV
jgi:hypothetical protein